MLRAPKTKDEAIKIRYGSWAGNPKGTPYQEGKCAYEVWPRKGRWIPSQCGFKAKCGPGNLYCKTHAKIVENK